MTRTSAARFVALDIHAEPIANGMEHLITRDAETGLEWTDASAGRGLSQPQAMVACEAVSIAGGGWRAPTRQELQSFLDLSREKPAFHPPAFPFVKPSWYWSSDLAAWSPGSAWGVGFDAGYSVTYPLGHQGYALAVRLAAQRVAKGNARAVGGLA